MAVYEGSDQKRCLDLSSVFLNADIALTILALIPGVDLIPLRAVNRRWRDLMARVPARVTLPPPFDFSKTNIGLMLPHLVKLRCTKMSSSVPLAHLRSLTTNQFNQSFLSETPKLTRLCILDSFASISLQNLTILTDLRCLKMHDTSSAVSPLTFFTNLETLRLGSQAGENLIRDACILTLRNLRLVEAPLTVWPSSSSWLLSRRLTLLTQLITRPPITHSMGELRSIPQWQELVNQLPSLLPNLQALVMMRGSFLHLTAVTHISCLAVDLNWSDIEGASINLPQLQRLHLVNVRSDLRLDDICTLPLLTELQVIDLMELNSWSPCSVKLMKKLLVFTPNLVSLLWQNQTYCDIEYLLEDLQSAILPLSSLKHLSLCNFTRGDFETTDSCKELRCAFTHLESLTFSSQYQWTGQFK